MNELHLVTDDGRTWYLPGGSIRGRARWRLERDPEAIEVRLFWLTSGKGTEEAQVVALDRFESPGLAGERPFELAVPDGPYSFSGRLITLAWALEVVALPSEGSSRLDLIVGPRPVEVDIRALREL
jgi:hypothetical protein